MSERCPVCGSHLDSYLLMESVRFNAAIIAIANDTAAQYLRDRDALRAALRAALAEILAHQNDYHHITDPARIAAWRKLLDGD